MLHQIVRLDIPVSTVIAIRTLDITSNRKSKSTGGSVAQKYIVCIQENQN
jgi:hypothetical protein